MPDLMPRGSRFRLFSMYVWAVAANLVLAFLAAPAFAQSHIQEWFDAEWSRAGDLPDLGSAAVRWSLELPPFDAEERSALRARSLAAGTEVSVEPTLRTLWSQGPGKWRINTDIKMSGSQPYLDVVVTPRAAWQMGPHALVIAGDEGDEQRQILGREVNDFWSELSLHLDGGLTTMKRGGLTPGPVSLRDGGDRWHVRFSTREDRPEGGMVVEVMGIWDEAAKRGFPQSMTFVQHPAQPARVGAGRRFNDWRFVEPLNRFVAHEVRWFSPDGSLERRHRVDRAWVDPTPFEELTRVPRDDGHDPVRGAVTFNQITDHRARERTTSSDGVVSVETLPEPTRSANHWRTWLGWVAAGLLAIGLLSIYLRRRAASH